MVPPFHGRCWRCAATITHSSRSGCQRSSHTPCWPLFSVAPELSFAPFIAPESIHPWQSLGRFGEFEHQLIKPLTRFARRAHQRFIRHVENIQESVIQAFAVFSASRHVVNHLKPVCADDI